MSAETARERSSAWAVLVWLAWTLALAAVTALAARWSALGWIIACAAVPMFLAGAVVTVIFEQDDTTWRLLCGAAVVPLLFTLAVLCFGGPLIWHHLSGRQVDATVIQVIEPGKDGGEGNGRLRHYRIADSGTERALGVMWHGPHRAARPGDRFAASVTPGGWSRPIAAERLGQGESLASMALAGFAVTSAVFFGVVAARR